MAGRGGDQHTAKFVVLTDSESIANAKKNYLTWIISGTVLFGITVGFLCYKVFIAPTYFNYNQPVTAENGSVVTVTPENSPPESLFPETNLRKLVKEQSDFLCDEHHLKLEAIPLASKQKLLQQRYSERIYDHINTDLLIHYESVMNKYSLKDLKTIFNRYQLELSEVRESADFINFLSILASNKFKFYSGYLKKKQFRLNLSYFDSFFALTEELNQWYNYLDRLRNFISDYEQQSRRKDFEKITALNFMKFTNETQLKIFRFVYPFVLTEKKLDEVNEVLKEWTNPVRVDYNNCSVTLSNRAVLLSEVTEQLDVLNASCVQNVHVFAMEVLYLDEDLKLPGVNLAIVSPDWRFLEKIKINLDGDSGEEHFPKTASPGQSGKPGNPGTNGGDFLGVGRFEENFLSVSANGGTGGSGQNGAKGRDGLNNTRPSLSNEKPTCAVEVTTVRTLFLLNVTYYKIYNDAGCGDAGTDGGVGGVGGYGGVIILINQSSAKVIKGGDGASGTSGKGGAGGKGGRNACFYEAADKNDEFLYRISTIKCSNSEVLPAGTPGKDDYNTQALVFPPPKQNLSIHSCVFDYIRLVGEHSDSNRPTISFLSNFNVLTETDVDDVLNDFEVIEKFNSIDFYEFFIEKVLGRFSTAENTNLIIINYLKSIALGRMTYLKNNVNYFFVDIKNYLNIVETSIKKTSKNDKQPEAITYFKKKVWMKIDDIKESLNLLKENAVVENRVSCITLLTIDVINLLIDRTNESSHLQLNTSLSECFETVQPMLKSLALLGSNRTILIKSPTERSLVRTLLEELLVEGSELRDVPEESRVEGKAQLFDTLIEEVERFIAVYDFLEWDHVADSFLKSLDDLKINESRSNAEIESLRSKLLDVEVGVLLKLREDALRQTVRPLPAGNFFQLSTKDLNLNELNLAEDITGRSSFCKNQMKAVFEKNSTVGPFFSWPNAAIKNKLKTLFSGEEIHLKSSLINRHVLGKSFLQFASLKLDFDCFGNESFCEKFQEVLMNFKIEITHPGYSFYNWGDETHVVVSEKVTLSYNFKTRENLEPEIYNSFFKKCQEGEIRLSPFTTWTVRLFLMNENASFKMLAPFSDAVSLNLVGSGTYIF